MWVWTSSFTELGTWANEDALDRYDTASLNEGEGEYISSVRSKVLSRIFEANITLLCNQ